MYAAVSALLATRTAFARDDFFTLSPMNWTVFWLIVMVVSILLAPFAALRAVSVWKARRLPPPLPKDADRDDSDDRSSW